MSIDRKGTRTSTFGTCLAAGHIYGLSASQARDVVDRVVTAIQDGWADAAEQARLSQFDRERLWARQFLNPAASYDLPKVLAVPARRPGRGPVRGNTTPGSTAGSFAPRTLDETDPRARKP
jgi:hypothetical protein